MSGGPAQQELDQAAGYFRHPQALVESDRVGGGTRIWAFAHVLPGAVIGRDCNICDHVFIENDVVVGDRVTVKCGVQLWDGVTLEDDVFVGPNATFTNDRFPRSKQYPERFPRTVIRAGASIGANATILPGIEIGQGAMVGAGAVVTRNVPPGVVVTGSPARIRRTVAEAREGSAVARAPVAGAVSVRGVALHHIPVITDDRGSLSFAQVENHLPFPPRRYFLLFDLPVLSFLTGFPVFFPTFLRAAADLALTLPAVMLQPFQLMSKMMPFGSLNLRSKSSSSGSPRSKKNLPPAFSICFCCCSRSSH